VANYRYPPEKRKRKGPRSRFPQERLDRTLQLLLAMTPYSTIERVLSKEWGIGRKHVRQYIVAVHEEMREQSDLHLPGRRNQIRSAFEQTYMAAMAARDLKAANVALREMAHLDGCYAPKQVNVTGTLGAQVGVIGNFGFKSPDEVQARIQELMQEVGLLGAGTGDKKSDP
jgi:hypothetical protein